MKRMSSLGLVLLVGLVWATPATAQEEHPFQVALLSPIQAFPEQDAIRGLRLSLIYGRNASVRGLDVGLVSSTTRDFLGAQFGVAGIAEGTFVGFQNNWILNRVAGDFEGLQWGFVNSADNGRGVQVSALSHARNFRGLQLGLLNYAETLDGVQIGVVNIIKHGGQFPVMVLVNWGSGD